MNHFLAATFENDVEEWTSSLLTGETLTGQSRIIFTPFKKECFLLPSNKKVWEFFWINFGKILRIS